MSQYFPSYSPVILWPQILFTTCCSGSTLKTELLIPLIDFSIALIILASNYFTKKNQKEKEKKRVMAFHLMRWKNICPILQIWNWEQKK